MKTAISIPDEVFQKVEAIIKTNNWTRSEFFTLAVKEKLAKLETKRMIEELNDVYSEDESPAETTLSQKRKNYHANAIIREKY